MLGGLPLALTQAAAYIEKARCGLAGYMERYQQRRRKLLEETRGLTSEHPDPVTTTWSLSFERVAQASAAAADLLRLCAFLHPDAIPEEIITQGAAELGPALATIATDLFTLDNAIIELRKYSLHSSYPETKTLSIHRLVQAVIIDEMAQDTQQQWAARVVRAVQHAFPETGEHEQWSQCEHLLPHIHVCADLITQWHMAFSVAASLLNAAGGYVCKRGQYTEAEVLLTQALTMREHLLGSDHLDVAQSLNNLAGVYGEQGRYGEAEELYRRALKISEQVLGGEHPATATSLNNLAGVYGEQGRYIQAEPRLKRALAIRERVLDQRHTDTANSLYNLAVLYHSKRNYSAAEPHYQRALAIYEQIVGPGHPHTLLVMKNYASLLQQANKRRKANAMLQRIAEIEQANEKTREQNTE